MRSTYLKFLSVLDLHVPKKLFNTLLQIYIFFSICICSYLFVNLCYHIFYCLLLTSMSSNFSVLNLQAANLAKVRKNIPKMNRILFEFCILTKLSQIVLDYYVFEDRIYEQPTLFILLQLRMTYILFCFSLSIQFFVFVFHFSMVFIYQSLILWSCSRIFSSSKLQVIYFFFSCSTLSLVYQQ